MSAPIFAVVRFVEELDEYKWQAYAPADGGLPEVIPVAGGSFGRDVFDDSSVFYGPPAECDLALYVAELAGVEHCAVAIAGGGR